MLLGVNVDHVATLREARGTDYPDPLVAALLAEEAGADGITVHLREDRRHIQDADVERMATSLNTRLNLEMAVTDEMLAIACRLQPFACCLVPEKRAELTTEGGLNVAGQHDAVAAACSQLADAGIRVSLFIDPDERQIDAAVACGAPVVELHTGTYADNKPGQERDAELARVEKGASFAAAQGLIVHAGHGLNFNNVGPVAAIPEIEELNIGHFLIAQSVFDGLGSAVGHMKKLMLAARA